MTLLPQPDSPTTARVWPGWMVMLTPSTACVRPVTDVSLEKETARSRTGRRGGGGADIEGSVFAAQQG